MTARIAATDEHPVSPKGTHVRERHRLIVKQEVQDRPGHRLSKRRGGGRPIPQFYGLGLKQPRDR